MITDRNYFFFQAYELLGRHLFGGTWTGYEIQETKMESPEAIEALRMPLEAEIAKLDDQDTSLEAERRRTTSDAVMEQNLARSKELRQTRSVQLAALEKLPRLDDRYRERFQALERRKKSEEQLVTALSDGALSAMYGLGLMVPKDLWAGTPGFKYFLDLSIAVMPSSRSGLRRGPVFIPKVAFDEWVGGIPPEVMDDSVEVTPRMLCEIFLRKVSAGPKLRTKTEYLDQAMAEIDGLTERQFRIVWDQVVPNHWKKPGRRRKSEKS